MLMAGTCGAGIVQPTMQTEVEAPPSRNGFPRSGTEFKQLWPSISASTYRYQTPRLIGWPL